MSEKFNYAEVIEEAKSAHASYSCDCGDRDEMIRHGIRVAFKHIETEARRLASQTADSDSGLGRFAGLQEIAMLCARSQE